MSGSQSGSATQEKSGSNRNRYEHIVWTRIRVNQTNAEPKHCPRTVWAHLTEDISAVAVDEPMASHDRVSRDLLLLHAEVRASVLHEHVVLHKGPLWNERYSDLENTVKNKWFYSQYRSFYATQEGLGFSLHHDSILAFLPCRQLILIDQLIRSGFLGFLIYKGIWLKNITHPKPLGPIFVLKQVFVQP